MRRGLVALAALASCVATSSVSAHTRSQSHSTWEINGTDIDLVLTIPSIEADRITHDNGSPSDDTLKQYLIERVFPLASNSRCALVPPVETLSAAQGFRRLDFTFKCDSALELKIHSGAFFDVVPSHTNFAQVQNAATGEFTEQLFTNEHQTVAVTGGEGGRLKSARFFEFIRMGTMHIFTGVDHMSFLLGLVLISRRLRDLVFVVTGFTIGHSLTLALAVTGVLRPHAEFIDALVALTIALIGAENIVVQTRKPQLVAGCVGILLALMALLQVFGFGDLPSLLLLGAALFTVNYLLISGNLADAGRLRMLITLVFGLIHGFGFAADLLELQLPPERLAELLVGFNLGVEAGQLTLVVGATLLVIGLRKMQLALPRPIVVDVASAFLVGLGVFWFVGRSFAADDQLQPITVTAVRLSLLGSATTASQGVVVNDELALLPAYRVGQLLETVPGLQVTSHSGEGKANQYLLRGYNLDHGTDLATFVDEMPVNQPTHAHGEGYTDLNFMIPELATNLSYTKGPYYADEGDFSSVGSIHVGYLNRIDDQIQLAAGTFGFQRIFIAGSNDIDAGSLLGALELEHYDGPWVNPDDQRKVNAVVRYHSGDGQDGYSLTAMYYHGLWNSTTDQPARAMEEGLLSRFGSLDPTDGGAAQRSNLTGAYDKTIAGGHLHANAYVFTNQLTLWNNFTHVLVDPVNGDQEAQREDRTALGGAVSFERSTPLFGLDNDYSAGGVLRNDDNDVSRYPTNRRVALAPMNEPLGFTEADQVKLLSLAGYVQASTHWAAWFRSVLGLRIDRLSGSDTGSNAGTASGRLVAPKASFIFRPLESTELYVSAGRGFHSDDLRGATSAEAAGQRAAPLIARQSGAEIGIREQFNSSLTATLAIYTLTAESETTYNPDDGVDSAGPGSRRRGVELNLTYAPLQWLELYASYSLNHARFTTPYADGTGHVGDYLPNAPSATGSFNLYVKDLGAWNGGLGYRYLSAYPLSSDAIVQGHGYGEWNSDARYTLGQGWSVGLGVFNILNRRDNAAEFWYIDRLSREPSVGIADVHVHPLEPRSARLTISKTF